MGSTFEAGWGLVASNSSKRAPSNSGSRRSAWGSSPPLGSQHEALGVSARLRHAQGGGRAASYLLRTTPVAPCPDGLHPRRVRSIILSVVVLPGSTVPKPGGPPLCSPQLRGRSRVRSTSAWRRAVLLRSDTPPPGDRGRASPKAPSVAQPGRSFGGRADRPCRSAFSITQPTTTRTRISADPLSDK